MDNELLQSILKFMDEEAKKPRGGQRDGSGRKKIMEGVKTCSFNLRLPKPVVDLIDDNFRNRAEFIRQAIKEKLIRERLV